MAKKKVEEMTAEQVATGTLENEVAEGANEQLRLNTITQILSGKN